jgi:hypothetical protein
MSRITLVATCLLATLTIGAAAASSALAQPKALIDDETVTEGATSQEAKAAEKAGFAVTVVSDETWGSMTQAEFGEYDLLIAGDPTCSTLPPGLISSAPVYGPVVRGLAGGRTAPGNRIVIGTDPVFHDGGDFESPGARGTVIRDGIAYAGKASGRTGMYFDASCAGEIGQATQVLEILAQLSSGSPSWTIDSEPPCGGNVSLTASNPAFSELTTESLAGWGCSVHESFPTFPAEWSALAVATDTESHPTCGVDPNTEKSACGEAYLLVAGSGTVVKSEDIELSPAEATNPVGTDREVTAHVTSGGAPLAGQAVTFTVTGTNAGASGTCVPAECVTDASGNVSFTYHDGNGAGEDTIKASFTDKSSSLQSATAIKRWVQATEPPAPTTITTTLAGEGKSRASLTVKEGAAVTDSAVLAGANAATAGGSVTYRIYTDSKCEAAATEAGTVAVSEGNVPPSAPQTLKPGTYYWQASYSGDAGNEASESACRSEVEKVRPICSKVVGEATVGEGIEFQRLRNNLSTSLAGRQKFNFAWERGRKRFFMQELENARCAVTTRGVKTFSGHGEGTLNGLPEYLVAFVIKITPEEVATLKVRIRSEKTREIVQEFETEELEGSTEVIS